MSGLTYQDTAKVLRRLGALDLVLIGGQAVNFWSEFYRSRVPALTEGPFTSKDIDFQGGRDVAKLCAERLDGARLELQEIGHAGAHGAQLFFELEGETHVIDFLSAAHGVDEKEVRARSIVVRVGDDPSGPRDISFRVMHPVDCLRSRTKNVMGLPGYDTPEALQQLRASIWCAREFIADLARAGASGDVRQGRAALKLSKEIFLFCWHDMHARALFRARAIDPFDAVQPHPGMPERFRSDDYPRKLARLTHRRRVRVPP